MPLSTNSRGQIQMGETIAVIMVFMVIIIFGLMAYVKFSSANDVMVKDELTRLQMLEKTKEVMNLPEMQCSFASKTDSTCLDYYRVRALKKMLNNDDFNARFEDRFFGFKLDIHILYPDTESMPPGINVFSFEPPGSTGYAKSAIPIVLEDPVTERKYFSMLVLTQFTTGGAAI